MGRMEKIEVFDNLDTAPFGAVVVYKVKFPTVYGKKEAIVVTFDDGNTEEVWGAGVDLIDALEVASREYSHYFDNTPQKDDNPFQELLSALLSSKIDNIQ
jgi:hypothetical protein